MIRYFYLTLLKGGGVEVVRKVRIGVGLAGLVCAYKSGYSCTEQHMQDWVAGSLLLLIHDLN